MITRIEYVGRHPYDGRVPVRTASIIYVHERLWTTTLYEGGEWCRTARCESLTSAQGKARAWVNGWIGARRKRHGTTLR